MKKTTTTEWNLSPQDVREAIRSHFGLPADASVTVQPDGSAKAMQVVPDPKNPYADFLMNIKPYIHSLNDLDFKYDKFPKKDYYDDYGFGRKDRW